MLRRYLQPEGFEVMIAGNGDEMRDQLHLAELVLLDLHLPNDHGLDLAREIRQKNPRLGIIIVTGSTDAANRVVGLESGADDYVSKPFDERELLARIRSLLRRTLEPSISNDDLPSTLKFANYRLNLDGHQLVDDWDRNIELTSHEFLLLSLFARSHNRVLSRDRIMDELSGRDWIPSDRSVDQLVVKLRRKIESDPKQPELIKTIRGAGYKFTTKVESSR
jgi:DNA-binding response OmpR family regulator